MVQIHGHLTEGVDLPVGGVALGRVCACSLSSRLVQIGLKKNWKASTHINFFCMIDWSMNSDRQRAVEH